MLFDDPVSLLLERNVINAESSIVPFCDAAKAHVPADAPNRANILKWIDSNLRKFLIRDYPKGVEQVAGTGGAERLTEPREGIRLDGWVYKKAGADMSAFLKTDEFILVTPSRPFKQEIDHVIDYLVATTPAGRDLSNQDIPNAIKRAREWTKASSREEEKRDIAAAELRKQGKVDPKDDSPYVTPLIKYGDGRRWVKFRNLTDADITAPPPNLATEFKFGAPSGSARSRFNMSCRNPVMRRETYYMNHCIGASNTYSDRLKNGQAQYYSFRTAENIPKLTAEMFGPKISQIYGVNDQMATREYFPFIKDLLNHDSIKAYTVSQDRNDFTVNAKLIRGKNGYVDAEDIERLSRDDPQALARFNLGREELRKFELIQVGDRVYSLKSFGDLVKSGKISRRDLKSADLSDDEYRKLGFVKSQSGEYLSWSEMGGQTVATDVSFEGLVAPVELPRGIVFGRSVKFRGYPGRSIPAIKVGGDLEIAGGAVTEIEAGLEVGGTLTISGISLGQLHNVTCKNLVIEARVDRITGVRVSGTTKLKGQAVTEIGRGCSFAKVFDASESSLRAVSSDAVFGSHAYFTKCPIESFSVKRVRGSLLLDSSGLTTFGTTSVGFDEGGRPPDPLLRDKNGGLGELRLEGTKVKTLPDGLHVADEIRLPKTVKELPSGMRVGAIFMVQGSIKRLPPDIKFNKVIVAKKANSYTTYHEPKYLDKINAQYIAQKRTPVKNAMVLKAGDEIPDEDAPAKKK